MRFPRLSFIAVLVLSTCVSLLLTSATRDSLAQTKTEATVITVVDGDTLRLRIGQDRQLLRLIGIDTPESRINKRAEKQAERSFTDTDTIIQLGERAKSAVSGMVPVGTRVSVEFDVERRDHYGRLLGYVYLPDGSMLNEKILSMGYGKLLTVSPNIRHSDRLRAAFAEGRTGRRGLWSMEGFADTQLKPHPPLPSLFKRR
jgi:micrococcal nuclease